MGELVITSGIVGRASDPDGSTYYVLADQAQNLVALEPASVASRFVGTRVTVTGTFTVAPGSQPSSADATEPGSAKTNQVTANL